MEKTSYYTDNNSNMGTKGAKSPSPLSVPAKSLSSVFSQVKKNKWLGIFALPSPTENLKLFSNTN